MMKALTEFLVAGLKMEQPKTALQVGDSHPQRFAETMEQLLTAAPGGSQKLTSADEQTILALGGMKVSAKSELSSQAAKLTSGSTSITQTGNLAEQPRHLIEAETMHQLMGDFTMDIMKPGQDAPKTTQDTAASTTDPVGFFAATSELSEEGSSPANFQETMTDLTSLSTRSQAAVTNELVESPDARTSTVIVDAVIDSRAEIATSYFKTSAQQMPDAASVLTSTALSAGSGVDQGLQILQGDVAPTGPTHAGLSNTVTGSSIPSEITLNMVETGRKLSGRSPEVPSQTVTVTPTPASISSANTTAVITREAIGVENSIVRAPGTPGEFSELFDVGERLPLSKVADRPTVDPRLETQADRVAVASTAAVVKAELTARQSVSFDAGIKLSNTEPQQFAGEMATHVRVLKSQSGGEVKLNLHPAELGRMSISVSTEGNETRVAFVVETSQARQAVEAALPRLRDMLENAGLSLSDSDVSEQRNPQADSGDKGPGSSRGDSTSPDGDDVSATTVLSLTVDPDRLVDTYI